MKQKAIEHYERIKKWIETQPDSDKVDNVLMQDQIGERWFSQDCDYCLKFTIATYNFFGCDACPLWFGSMCCGGFWVTMNDSETWGEFLIALEKVIDFIKDKG